MDSIRFQLDEHIDRIVALTLRQRGIDIVTAHEAGLLGEPDERVLQAAHANSRVIVTLDNDFLRLNASGYPHSGIVYFKPLKRSVGVYIETLLTIHGVLTSEEMIGRVHYM